jgi:hypothetical protein
MKLTTHLHLVVRLGMSGAIPLLPYLPSWYAEEQVYHYFDNGLRTSEMEYSKILKLVKNYVLPTAETPSQLLQNVALFNHKLHDIAYLQPSQST